MVYFGSDITALSVDSVCSHRQFNSLEFMQEIAKGIEFNKISGVLTEMRNSLSRALFVSANSTPLSEKEIKSLDVMNEICGEDTDQVYAQHTHYHLTKKLRENGI